MVTDELRIGQAASLLAVSVDTLRRWEQEGLIETVRSEGGQRLIPLTEVRRLLEARRTDPPPVSRSSARNQMEAVVISVTADRASAVVEMQAGPFRLVALTTAESVSDLGLEPGTEVVASVKATNVVVGLPR